MTLTDTYTKFSNILSCSILHQIYSKFSEYVLSIDHRSDNEQSTEVTMIGKTDAINGFMGHDLIGNIYNVDAVIVYILHMRKQRLRKVGNFSKFSQIRPFCL